MESLTYTHDPQAEISTKRRVIAFLLTAVYSTWSDFHWNHVHDASIGYRFAFSAFKGLLFATYLLLVTSMAGRSEDVTLTVTDAEMVAVTRRWWWPEDRRDVLRKGRLRTVTEGSLTLKLSERGRLDNYILGVVSIPKSLLEYNQIKALAESWRSPALHHPKKPIDPGPEARYTS